MALDVEDRVAGGMYGMMVGDALAVPLHWYYNRDKLVEHRAKYYGGTLDNLFKIHPDIISEHPGSAGFFQNVLKKKEPAVMALIPESQLPLWETPNIHYHATMDKGENTISTELAKLLCDSIVKNGGSYSPVHYVDMYIAFFTTPLHNDLYLEGIHKFFFRRLKEGTPKLECGTDDETCLSGITFILPLAFLYHNDKEKAHEAIKTHMEITHRSDEMNEMAFNISDLISDLMNGKDPKESIEVCYNRFPVKLALEKCLEKKSDEELYTQKVFPIA